MLQLTSATDPLASGANKYQGPARSGDRKVAFAVEVAHQSKGAGVGNTRRYSNPTGQRADMHSATGVLNIISSHATAHLRWSLSCPDTQGIRETINLEVTNMQVTLKKEPNLFAYGAPSKLWVLRDMDGVRFGEYAIKSDAMQDARRFKLRIVTNA